MLLGDNFYTKLNKLTIWRQSLFALVLATRQYPNFALWTEIKANPDPNANKAYLQALHTCWLYFADRFNHIDLLKASDELDPYISNDQDDQSDGYAYASDCSALMCAALEGIPLGIAYGFDASNASLASVIRLCESKYPEIVPDTTTEAETAAADPEKQAATEATEEEALLELEEIAHELDFQVELLQKISQPRNLQLVRELLTFALQEQSSNIGLETSLTTADFPEIFDPRLDEQEKASAQNAAAAAAAENAQATPAANKTKAKGAKGEKGAAFTAKNKKQKANKPHKPHA